MEVISNADTIKEIHIAYRQAIREGADPLAANRKRDEAIGKLRQRSVATTSIMS